MVSPEVRAHAATLKLPESAAVLYGYRNTRESVQAQSENQYGYPHISPGSVLICPIGTMWEPGAWECVTNMAVHTKQLGYNVGFEEMKDGLATVPYGLVGAMRDQAAMTAQTRGFEWFCMVDNDVLPEPDLLVKLMAPDVAVIGPRAVTTAGEMVGSPQWKIDEGVRPMRWMPFSFLLMRTAVLNCFDRPFSATAPEGNFFMQLWRYGHRAYQHTGAVLKLAQPPAVGAKTSEGYAARMKAVDRRRRLPPDRRPVSPKTPSVDGVYLPWFASKAEADASTA